jgi:hypothetical protein
MLCLETYQGELPMLTRKQARLVVRSVAPDCRMFWSQGLF